MTIHINTEKAKELTKRKGMHWGTLIDDIKNGKHGAVTDEAKAAISLEYYKQELKTIREDKEKIKVTVNGQELSALAKDRREMQHYVTDAVTNGLVNVYWQKPDGTFHTYTVQEFKPVYRALVHYINALFLRHKELLEALEAAPDPSTVNLQAGWPTTTYTVS